MLLRFVVLLPALVGAALAQSGTAVLHPSKDCTIYQPGNLTANGAGNIVVGRTAQCSIRRALIRFDVAGAVPIGATIQDATLTLPVIGGSTSTVVPNVMELTFSRLLQDWGEGTTVPSSLGQGAAPTTGAATWIHSFFPGALWASAGADFAAPSGTMGLSTSGDGSVSSHVQPGLLTDVQNWLDQPASNFGYIFETTASSCQFTRVLCSRECASPRPTLSVTWTLGGPVPASVARDGFVFPGTTPDRQLIATGLPTLGNGTFRLQLPVVGPLPSLYAGLPATPFYLGSAGLFLHLDLTSVAVFLSAGFGPFPAVYDPATFYPTWTFPVPNDPALADLVVSFQCAGLGPFGGLETTNGVTLRVGN